MADACGACGLPRGTEAERQIWLVFAVAASSRYPDEHPEFVRECERRAADGLRAKMRSRCWSPDDETCRARRAEAGDTRAEEGA